MFNSRKVLNIGDIINLIYDNAILQILLQEPDKLYT